MVYIYPGAGHFCTGDTVPDRDRAATELTSRRASEFLAGLEPGPI